MWYCSVFTCHKYRRAILLYTLSLFTVELQGDYDFRISMEWVGAKENEVADAFSRP